MYPMNPTHPIETAIHEFRKAEEVLAAEAKKALPIFLLTEALEDGRTIDGVDFHARAEKCWFEGIDSDNEITFESDDDYHYMPLEFVKDPQKHLNDARLKAAQREAERFDRNLRLRNERIREAKATLAREGIDFLIIEN